MSVAEANAYGLATLAFVGLVSVALVVNVPKHVAIFFGGEAFGHQQKDNYRTRAPNTVDIVETTVKVLSAIVHQLIFLLFITAVWVSTAVYVSNSIGAGREGVAAIQGTDEKKWERIQISFGLFSMFYIAFLMNYVLKNIASKTKTAEESTGFRVFYDVVMYVWIVSYLIFMIFAESDGFWGFASGTVLSRLSTHNHPWNNLNVASRAVLLGGVTVRFIERMWNRETEGGFAQEVKKENVNGVGRGQIANVDLSFPLILAIVVLDVAFAFIFYDDDRRPVWYILCTVVVPMFTVACNELDFRVFFEAWVNSQVAFYTVWWIFIVWGQALGHPNPKVNYLDPAAREELYFWSRWGVGTTHEERDMPLLMWMLSIEGVVAAIGGFTGAIVVGVTQGVEQGFELVKPLVDKAARKLRKRVESDESQDI